MEEEDDEGEEDAHPDFARCAGVIATRSRFFLTWVAMTPFYLDGRGDRSGRLFKVEQIYGSDLTFVFRWPNITHISPPRKDDVCGR